MWTSAAGSVTATEPPPRTTERETLAIAREALACFDFSRRSALTVVQSSADTTLLVDDPVNRERAAMRIHRPGFHTKAQIGSELLWLDALRADRSVEVPPPISSHSGGRVVSIDVGEGPRFVSVRGWLDGEALGDHPDPSRGFFTLGAATARLHAHAAGWELPPGFCRRHLGGALEAGPGAGSWLGQLTADPPESALLERAERAVLDAMAGFSTSRGEYGLVHGDLRLANLLRHERDGREVVSVIDFDDCGQSWFLYDFGAAVALVDDAALLPALAARWVQGYRTAADLSAEREAQLPTFVMRRRLERLAAALRGEPGPEPDARSAPTASLVRDTCELAERYLSGRLL